jgi:hypothetical protein
MDIKAQLLSELSRTNIDFTIHTLGNNPDTFKELINFIFTEPDPLPMRASWVVEGITEKYPGMILPYVGMLIRNLRKYSHPGTRRNLLKVFSRMEIPEKYHGILLDICFEWITKEDRTVAEKVFAMQIIANHLKYYPELTNEFIEIIDDQTHKNSPGFASRVRKIKTEMKKILKS